LLSYYKENIQLYLLFTIWLVTGIFGGPVIYVVLPLTLLLMKRKELYEELFIGYLFILIISDSAEDSLVFAKSIKNIYIASLAVFFLFDMKSFQPINQLYKTFLPFFLFAVFTMCFSVTDPFFFTSVQKTLSYFLTFLVLPNFFVKLFRESGEAFIRRFMLFCFTTLLVGLILKFLAPDIAYLESGRFRGVMGNPNGLGIYSFMLFIVFFVVNDFFSNLFSRQERILIYALILISMVMTNSRNAVMALFIFYVFQRFFTMSPFFGFIIFLITIFVVEIVSANLTTILGALGLGDFFRVNTLEDGSGRYIAWNFAWLHIQENFFVGKGFAYNEYYMRQNYGLLSKLGHQGGIHNSFLTFWMDQGLIGLLIYLRSYILMFMKAASQNRFAYPILFALSFTAMFESWLVGSLSAFAFMSLFIFTLITSDEIHAAKTVPLQQPETI
jgi:hypothetical protein